MAHVVSGTPTLSLRPRKLVMQAPPLSPKPSGKGRTALVDNVVGILGL